MTTKPKHLVIAEYHREDIFEVPPSVDLHDPAVKWRVKYGVLTIEMPDGGRYEIEPTYHEHPDYKHPTQEVVKVNGDWAEITESYERKCRACKEEFTPSIDHERDWVCDDCVSGGRVQVVMTDDEFEEKHPLFAWTCPKCCVDLKACGGSCDECCDAIAEGRTPDPRECELNRP